MDLEQMPSLEIRLAVLESRGIGKQAFHTMSAVQSIPFFQSVHFLHAGADRRQKKADFITESVFIEFSGRSFQDINRLSSLLCDLEER